MGNTKYIWFAGEFKKEVELTEAVLLEKSHGAYACVKEDAEGYLGLNKYMQSDFKWEQGMVHTYSMAGAGLIDYLQPEMVCGFIGFYDEDNEEYIHFDIDEGEVTVKKMYVW